MYEKYGVSKTGRIVVLTDDETFLTIPGYKKSDKKPEGLTFKTIPVVLRPLVPKPSNIGLLAALVGNKIANVSPITYLVKLIKDANKLYTEGNPKISDELYDWAVNCLTKLDSDNPILTRVGSTPTKGKKVRLPYWLGSLNKLYEGASAWAPGGAKVVPKVDGISCLVVYKAGNFVAAYTRGNGQVGQLISNLVAESGAVPLKLKSKMDLAIRGELVILNKTFDQQFKKQFANPRNLVAGLFNSKSANPSALRAVRFYGHSVLMPNATYSRGLTMAKNAGIRVLPMLDIPLDDRSLGQQLSRWRSTLPYDIDGLVLVKDREYKYSKSGNPKHSIAFKQNEEPKVATVVKIEWHIRRHGLYKPTIIVRPINLSGVTVERATGHNARYIYVNDIGPGAQVKLVRAGDVTPYVVEVVTGSRGGAQMPPAGTWTWNSTKVDAVAKHRGSTDQELQQFVHFFSALEVEGLRLGQLTALYDAGYKSIPQILKLKPSQIQRIERFGERSAAVLVNRLQNIKTTYPMLAYASGCFGRGLGRTLLTKIYETFGQSAFNWKGWKKSEIVEQLSAKGITPVASRTFAEGLSSFISFANQLKGLVKIVQPAKIRKKGTKLDGKTVVFTGFRNSELEKEVAAHGGTYKTSLPASGGSTVILVLKDTASVNGTKAEKAKKTGVRLMTRDQFEKLLNI